MGYILTPVTVDFKRVTGAVGSKDKRLLSTLVEEFGDEFEQFDELADDVVNDEDGAEVLTMQSVLTQMVMGEQYNEGLGFMYGYALEFVCRYFGEWLPNKAWSAMPSGSRLSAS